MLTAAEQFACGCRIWTQDHMGEKVFMYRACPAGRSCDVYAIVKKESARAGIPYMEMDLGP